MSHYEVVREQVLALDITERARLVDELLVELDGYENEELSVAWKAELDARLSAYRRGDVALIAPEESRRRLGLA